MARRVDDSPISDLMARALHSPNLISLAAGFVDHATLPVTATSEAVNSMLSDAVEGRRALQYGTTRGDLHLRTRLLGLIEASERVPSGTYESYLNRVVVTSGSQQLLYLVSEVLLDPGDIVLVESPTYFVFLGVLKQHGARVIGIPTDQEGLDPNALDQLLERIESEGDLSRVKLIYTISEHSNPTGLSLSSWRRPRMVEVVEKWCRRCPLYVLEDAAYRGLTYEGEEPASVWHHARKIDRVILARTFSKTFSPGLKLGYGILPEELVDPVLRLKGNHDFGSAHFAQQLLERVVAEGHYDRQVKLLVERYRRKRDAMLAALECEMGQLGMPIAWTHPRGGLYVWLQLPQGVNTGREGGYFDRCVEEGVIYVPGAYAFADEPAPVPQNYARLSFGVMEEAGITEGIRRMAKALQKQLRGGTTASIQYAGAGLAG
jgi:2-aminoadipate transaminase